MDMHAIAEGLKESVMGTLKNTLGALTGDESKQAEGKAEQLMGGVFRNSAMNACL